MFWIVPVLVILCVVGLIVLLMVFEARRQRLRTEAFAKVASEMGFEFFPTGQDGFWGDLSNFHLFQQGHSKQFRNLMRGTASGLEVGIFDYQFTTGHGKHSVRWRQTAIGFRSPDLDLPDFGMRPESFWHRLGQWFGYSDINFDSHAQFSKQYVLRGSSELHVRELFREPLLDYFTDHAGMNVEGHGDRLLVYWQARQMGPDQVRELMEAGFETLAQFRGQPA
jgi:hypothetical protein